MSLICPQDLILLQNLTQLVLLMWNLVILHLLLYSTALSKYTLKVFHSFFVHHMALGGFHVSLKTVRCMVSFLLHSSFSRKHKTNLTNLLDSSTSPITFDKDIVLRGFQEFISGLGLWNVFSLEELDFMYFNEFGSHIPQTEKYQHAREYQNL